ncbi:glycine cleavage system protein GcvH [Vagococcus intermedius]|uniref:Glycine cleavage system H protein n=1 Tax=Vagococcus intermedius TaxID=2991418 RepID=A0AAF0CTP9_9ENTE|nr:glycine cleavage system protein GcvH [Vagococcus intermedius]WEG72679.1 glycine cleavage system protein GcvH [Vagococcus intermedius]WEG74764.1 glycine cleavage system protein GcvH [Vagococcus intermedius]
MVYATNLYYTEEHEWIALNEDQTIAKIGITDFAQEQLGDVVYIGLPEVDDKFSKGESIAEVESVKSVSDIFSPLPGKIMKVNDVLEEQPELLNNAPFETWLVEVELEDGADVSHLLTADAYQTLVEQEG